MKYPEFPDFFPALFVKEIRQTLHEKQTMICGGILVVWELVLFYISGFDAPGETAFKVFFVALAALILIMQAHAAARTETERHWEGFDPAEGTGYPPWRILWGKFLARAVVSACLILLGLPVMIWSFAVSPVLSPGILCCSIAFLIFSGEFLQGIASRADSKKEFPQILILLILLAMLGLLCAISSARFRTVFSCPWLCGALLLAAYTAAGYHAANLMPPASDRAKHVKIPFFLLTLYCALWSGMDGLWEMPFFAAGMLLLFTSMLERPLPSSRQIAEAPGSPVLRGLSLFYTSGILPGFLAGILLAAIPWISLKGEPEDGLIATLLQIFYLQLALFVSGKTRLAPPLAWIIIAVLCNLPGLALLFPVSEAAENLRTAVPGVAALSLASTVFLAAGTAMAAAIAAAAAGVLLNFPLYREFAVRYFQPSSTTSEK